MSISKPALPRHPSIHAIRSLYYIWNSPAITSPSSEYGVWVALLPCGGDVLNPMIIAGDLTVEMKEINGREIVLRICSIYVLYNM